MREAVSDTRKTPGLLLFVVALLAATAMGLGAAERTLRAGERRFQEQQSLLVAHAAESIVAELSKARALLNELNPTGLPEDPVGRSVWLATHQGVYSDFSLHAVRIRGPGGVVLAQLGAEGATGTSGSSVCEGCWISDGVLTLAGSPDAQGRRAEVALSLASLSQRRLDPVRSGAEGYAWMLGPGGEVLGSPDPSLIGTRPFAQATGALADMVADMSAGRRGTAVYDWGEARRLAAYAPVPGSAMSVAISADVGEVRAELLEVLQLQAAAGMAFLGLVGLTLWALLREQRRHWGTQQRALAERLKLQEVAANADRLALLGTLTAGVAHELRSPLTVLLMLSEELADEGVDPELVRLTQAAIGSLERLSRDMTDFARRAPAEGSSCSPDEVVRGALRLVAPRVGRGQALDISLPDLPDVAMDAGRLGQVVMNLVLNAAQALDGAGTVRLRGYADGTGVRLRVEDDGPGIPEAIRPRLFEAFATSRAADEGTGLGLYLCRAMLESAGGWIRLDPDTQVGAAFELWLPQAQTGSSAAVPIAQAS